MLGPIPGCSSTQALQFAQPATLTILSSAQPSGNHRLVGLTYEGTGDSLALTAAKRQSNLITIAVSHFSGVIAGFGTSQNVEAIFLATTPPLTSANQIAADRLLFLSSQTPRDGAAELQVMEIWFDIIVLPALRAATTDAQLIAAIDAEMVTYARDALIEEAWQLVLDDVVHLPLHHQVIDVPRVT